MRTSHPRTPETSPRPGATLATRALSLLGTSTLLAASGLLALGMAVSTGTPAAVPVAETDTAQSTCSDTTISDTGEAQVATVDAEALPVDNDADVADDAFQNDDQDGDWDGRRPDRPVTVWMAGDSTMANPSAGTVCPVGWGNQFGTQFNANVTVVNKSIGGRSIQTWLYDPNVTSTMDPTTGECVISDTTYSARWQAMLDTTSGMQPGDYLFIQFGINDGSPTCPRHVGSARYEELMGMMVDTARARHVHPVVLTAVAAITCSGDTAVGNRGYLTEVKDVATSHHVRMIDLHSRSVALYNRLGLCPNNGDYTAGAVGAFFCNDHTHFEVAGALQIAEVVARALRQQHIPLGRYVIVKRPSPTATPTTTPSTTA